MRCRETAFCDWTQKKKKTKPNLNLGRYLRKVRVKRTAKISGTAIKSHHNRLLEGSGDTAKTYNIQNKQPKAKLLWLKEEFVTQTNYHNFDLSVDLTSGRSAKRQKYIISCRRTIIYDLQPLKKIKQLWYDATMCNAVAWGGAGGARAPPIIWQTPKNIYWTQE